MQNLKKIILKQHALLHAQFQTCEPDFFGHREETAFTEKSIKLDTRAPNCYRELGPYDLFENYALGIMFTYDGLIYLLSRKATSLIFKSEQQHRLPCIM